METTTILENFTLNCIAWHTVEDKIDIWTIENALNNHLDLFKYGKDLHQIQFQYIADYSEIHQEEMTYNPETKTLFLSLRLDFEQVESSTKAAVLTMMKELFLTSVFYYFAVGIRDFDFSGFYEDLKEIFEL